MNSAVLDVSPGLMTMRSLPVLNAFAYAVCGSTATPAGCLMAGKPVPVHTWNEVTVSSPPTRTFLPSGRVNTAVTVPSSACSRSVQASSNGCSRRTLRPSFSTPGLWVRAPDRIRDCASACRSPRDCVTDCSFQCLKQKC